MPIFAQCGVSQRSGSSDDDPAPWQHAARQDQLKRASSVNCITNIVKRWLAAFFFTPKVVFGGAADPSDIALEAILNRRLLYVVTRRTGNWHRFLKSMSRSFGQGLILHLSSKHGEACFLGPFKPTTFDARARHHPQAGIDRQEKLRCLSDRYIWPI